MSVVRRSWAQVPLRVGHARSRRRHGPAALAIGFGGPAALAFGAGTGPLLAVAVVAVAATATIRQWFPHRWAPRLVVAVTVAGAVATVASPGAGAWAGVGLLVGHWATNRDPPLPGLPRAGPGSLAPVLVLSAVATVAVTRGHGPWAAVPLVLACLTPATSALGGGAMARFAARIGDGAATAVSTVSFTLLGLLVVIVPWTVQRPLRIDPLSSTAGWTRRRRRHHRPTGLWTPDAALGPAPRHRLRAAALTAVILAPLVWMTPATRELLRPTDPVADDPRGFVFEWPADPDFDDQQITHEVPPGVEASQGATGRRPAALEDASWWEEYRHATDWAFNPAGAWRAVNPYRMLDVSSEHLNIVDGHRTSWQPPPCDCERITVWMYGGSTTFGLDQRDDHTIASELARLAHRDGLTVDVVNRGLPGHLHWMEAERFAWDVTMGEPPDLVLFYDGVNEAWASNWNNRDTGETPPLVDPTTIDLWASTGRSDGPMPDGPTGSHLLGWPTGGGLTLGDVAETMVARYDRSRALSRATAARHGIVARYVWQPSRYSRPLVPTEPHGETDGENRARLSEQLMVGHLPDDVIDATDAFLGTDDPLFVDDVHHNETGARLVAERLYEDLGTDLHLISRVKEQGP